MERQVSEAMNGLLSFLRQKLQLVSVARSVLPIASCRLSR